MVSLKSAGSLNNNQQWITILTAQWVDVGNVLGNEKMKSVKKKGNIQDLYTNTHTAICLILCTDIWSILQVLCTMHLHMQSIFSSQVSSHALILHLCMNQDSKYFCILSTCTFFSTKLVWNKDHFNSLCPPSFIYNNEYFCVSMWSTSTWIMWWNKSLSGDLKNYCLSCHGLQP